ncbi:hypothetical protein [Dysgonomonas sp. 25]|uniref:hypothetical protein n=1 Tax=Dysgonomonas sp. 25 TaxID=2302933 RepID=UPI0013D7B13B|nr:hypothetical protein [Dysgonomonas sp. 25]NDV69600.1 hypothetical protein [Dysgonomonas sp. 25]
MKLYSVLSYISLALFASSIILWYISGNYMKERKPALSRKVTYIGGFMFSFAIFGGLVALILWATAG